jgi:outer membrane lipoprotein-sorting protein
MLNKILYFILLSIFLTQVTHAQIKNDIVTNLDNTESINFSFVQSTNNKQEIGECLLLFPGKLKCSYNDRYPKELIINGKTLTITIKKNKKINTYYYPISKSPFLKILDKSELKKIINSSEIEYINSKISLKYVDSKNQTIFLLFDRNSFDLLGWLINDQFNNEIKFLININSKNNIIEKDTFKHPKFNN